MAVFFIGSVLRGCPGHRTAPGTFFDLALASAGSRADNKGNDRPRQVSIGPDAFRRAAPRHGPAREWRSKMILSHTSALPLRLLIALALAAAALLFVAAAAAQAEGPSSLLPL